MGRVLLVLLLMLGARSVAAQNDSATARCAAIAQARPDSMVKVDTEATPDRLPAMNEGPGDADQRAVVAHFVVTPEGRVDTTTVTVEHTRDAAWIDRLRRNLASATYKPARTGGCPVASWSTFAVWSGQP
jgi:hypothetical protein